MEKICPGALTGLSPKTSSAHMLRGKEVFMPLLKKGWRALCALCLTLLLSTVWAFALSPAAGTVYDGMDVSIYQGRIDFTAAAQDGKEAVYIRAGQGFSYVDPNYQTNFENAAAAGLDTGFYYYVTATNTADARTQAAAFARLIRGMDYTMRPAMDYESFGNLGAATVNAVGRAFLEELQRLTGQIPTLYSNTYSAQTVWSSDVAAYPLWVAQYNGGAPPENNGVWDSWSGYQYTSSGRVAGISGSVDLDWFTTRLFTATPLPPVSGGTNARTYTVRAGDTLWGIAQTYGTTVAALAAANGITDPDLIYPGELLQIPGSGDTQSGTGNTTGTYTVRAGDTLWGIAQTYGTTVAALAAANNLSDPSLIYPGEVLLIPGTGGGGGQTGSTYTVRAGDTLWGIAQTYGTTVAALTAANDISNPSLIYPGEVLLIP